MKRFAIIAATTLAFRGHGLSRNISHPGSSAGTSYRPCGGVHAA